MKIKELLETASSGSSSAGGIASVSGGIGPIQTRAVDAATSDVGFFTGKPNKSAKLKSKRRK